MRVSECGFSNSMVDRIPQNVAEKYTLAEVSRYRPAICVAFEQNASASVFRVEMLGISYLENLDKVIGTGADQRNVAGPDGTSFRSPLSYCFILMFVLRITEINPR